MNSCQDDNVLLDVVHLSALVELRGYSISVSAFDARDNRMKPSRCLDGTYLRYTTT